MKRLITLMAVAAMTLTSCNKDNGHDHAGHDHDGHDHPHDEKTAAHGEKGHVHTAECDHDHGDSPNAHPEGHETHIHGPHGGEIKDISSVGKLEYLLDEAKGTMTVYILGTDGKSVVEVSKAPQVVAVVDGKRMAVDFTAEKMPSSKFTLAHDIFKQHMDVNILVNIEGSSTPFLIPIPHHH